MVKSLRYVEYMERSCLFAYEVEVGQLAVCAFFTVVIET